MDASDKYYFPLGIKSEFKYIYLSKNVLLRKINNEELIEFFGTSNLELDSDNRLNYVDIVPGKGIYRFGDDILHFILANSLSVFLSNYVLVTNNKLDAQKFNSALKLVIATKSGVLIGFTKERKSLNFIYPNPFYEPLTTFDLDRINTRKIKEVFNLLTEKNYDSRFSLLLNLYINSISGSELNLNSRFIDLITLLEILYIPDGKNGEMKFKFSIRIAKVFKKYYKYNSTEVFDEFNNNRGFYAIRSDIVHTGKSDKLDIVILKNLIEYARKSLLLYLRNDQAFETENLKNILLN